MQPTEKMTVAGNEIASLLIDATCEKAFGGDNAPGGTKRFNIENYPAKYRGLITKYLSEEIVSVEAIYIAMEMEKE